jgi:hypothetical protein
MHCESDLVIKNDSTISPNMLNFVLSAFYFLANIQIILLTRNFKVYEYNDGKYDNNDNYNSNNNNNNL